MHGERRRFARLRRRPLDTEDLSPLNPTGAAAWSASPKGIKRAKTAFSRAQGAANGFVWRWRFAVGGRIRLQEHRRIPVGRVFTCQ